MLESPPKSDQRQELVKYAGRILTGRPYFKVKLKEKLFLRAEKLKYQEPGPIIEEILQDLSKSGYLNDEYLAGAYIRRQLSKGYGPKIISTKLKFMGLDSATIVRCLKNEVTEEQELASIKRYCQKNARLEQRKLVSKLYLRGYSGQLIKNTFDSDWLED